MRKLALICVLLALAASADDAPRFRGGRARLPRGGPSLSAKCARATTGPTLPDGSWSDFTNTSAVTRTVGFASDCSVGVERLQVPATTTAQFASIENPNGTLCPLGTSPLSAGCWIRGTSGSGTSDFTDHGGVYNVHPFSFTTAWAFVKDENITQAGGGADIMIGNLSAVSGVGRSAVDIQIVGCKCVAGATVSP